MAKYVIKIPPKCDPLTADNWRAVDAALREMTVTTNKVDSPTKGLTAVQGKVKVNQYDSTAEYLEDKIVEGNNIDFVQSNDGTGAKEIKVHFKLVVSDAEPSSPTEGMFWLDSDATFGTPFTIGDGEAGVDYELKFDGETHDGSIYWKEDEDYFQFADDVVLDETLTITGATTAAAITATNITANAYNIVCYNGDVVTFNDEVVTYG